MKWGISFTLPLPFKSDLWAIPPPSKVDTIRRWDGKEKLLILYQFSYSPQSWREWSRVAGIKVQLEERFNGLEFIEFEAVNDIERVYTVSELGKHFELFVKFPKPFVDGTPYQILCRYAKRLHYEKMLHVEQLIAASLWISTLGDNGQHRRPKQEGVRQCLRRAVSAYKFALDHKDEWPQKLNDDDRKKKQREGALKSAEVRKHDSTQKRELAKQMRRDKITYADIADELKVSLITVKRWCKKYH
jgi:hypothetical protein